MNLRCLFWNASNKPVDAELVALAGSTGANLIALAEYSEDSRTLIRELALQGMEYFSVPTLGCERITIITSFEPGRVTHKREADRYTIKELNLPGSIPILLGLVHLPSKLHASDIDQLHTASFFKEEVELAEVEASHCNTVIVGDFNMNPFDDGMMSAAAMNSLPCLITAKRTARVISGKPHAFFYNPTWNLLGDFNGSPGTYFRASPSYLSNYWNLLDQVILRPSIADRMDKKSLAVLTSAGPTNLINADGRP